MKKTPPWLTGLLIIAVAAVGFLIGRLTAPEEDDGVAQMMEDNGGLHETRAGGYQFINPLWECDNFHPSKLNSMVKMETDLNEYIATATGENKAQHVSIYFRDLNGGPWLGIDERANYSPASLLKVPILIAGLKRAESEPDFLKKKVLYNRRRELVVNPNIIDSAMLKMGNSYTVEDLMFRMVAHSDNEAKELLVESIGDQTLTKVLQDIGMNIEGVRPGDDFVSVKDYSSFFRLLYNATYLNREMSEKALRILNKTSFKKGLNAGIPIDIQISHKFGERAFDNSDIKQLHDCGIIYKPGAPYLLCVMTRGKDFKVLETVIAGVSEIVYKNVSATR